nr:glycosyltransferase [Propioniciclava soli]
MAEDYFLYWEDVDFSRRAADAGFSLVLRSDLEVVHDEGGTHGVQPSRAKSPLYYFYNTRNRLLFGARVAPAARLTFLAATPAESRRIFLRGGRRQLLTQPAGLASALRGSAAGVAAVVRARQRPRPGQARTAPARAVRRPVLVAHPSPDLYGSDRVLLESVTGYIEGGDRVVVALPAHGPLGPELEARGAEVVLCPAPVLRKSALSPRGMLTLITETASALPRAIRLMRRVDPDHVFVNTITNFVWLAAAKASGRHLVCHVHEAERSARTLVRKGLYAPLLLADHLIVNSRFALDVLTDTWPVLGARADIVSNGVPGPLVATDPRPELDETRVLFVGRLSPRKGPQVAVRALERLRSDGRRVHLALLGAVFPGYEWFERELHEEIARRGLTDHVSFLGFHPEIWPHLAAADIICVPSTVDEPFGNTAVEAMLAQRPLVVSDTSGLREAAAGYASARRVRPDDDAELAAAIADLTDHWAEVVTHVGEDLDLAWSRHAPAVYRSTLIETIRTRRAPAREGRETTS